MSISGGKEEINLRALAVEDLKPGMTLARTIVNDDMVVVLSENTLLTKAHITRLQYLNIPAVYIKDEYELSTNFQNVQAMLNPGNAFVTEYKEVIHTAEEIFSATAHSSPVPLEQTKRCHRLSLCFELSRRQRLQSFAACVYTMWCIGEMDAYAARKGS